MSLSAKSFTPALLLITLLAGCNSGDKSAPTQQKPPAQVSIFVVKTQKIAVTTELSGRTSPFTIAEIRPQINGIVKQRLFREGADVGAGEALYQIDAAPYQAALASAQANLAKAQANLATVQLKADRYRELIKINAVSQQEADDAAAALGQAKADVAMNQAAQDTARINLNYTRIISPVAGRAGISTVTPGALVTANQAVALTSVQQLDPIYVDVIQPSTALMQMKHALENGSLKRIGHDAARVKLTLEDNTPYALPGKLEFSDVTVNPGTGSVTLRAVFPNPKHDLLPGMFVRALLEEGFNDKGILVPQQGVTHDARGNATALVLSPDGTVELRILELGEAAGNQWIVKNGLNTGDQLIVDGLQKIKLGGKAVPVNPAKQ